MDTRGTLNGGTRPGHIDAGRGNNGRAAAFCVPAGSPARSEHLRLPGGAAGAMAERGFDAALAMSRIWSIYGSMFALLDSREGTEDKAKLAARAADMSVEARSKCSLRADALKLLLRFFNMRLNSRLSSVIYAYESIFDQMEAKGLSSLKALTVSTCATSPDASSPASMVAASNSQEQIHLLSGFFSQFDPIFKALDGNAFGKNIVSTPEIGSDLYKEGHFKDTTIEVMLDLCTFKNNGISSPHPPHTVVRGCKHVFAYARMSCVMHASM